jgi:hypothetical protein
VTEFAFPTDLINFVELIWERVEYIEQFVRSLKEDFGIDEKMMLE